MALGSRVCCLVSGVPHLNVLLARFLKETSMKYTSILFPTGYFKVQLHS